MSLRCAKLNRLRYREERVLQSLGYEDFVFSYKSLDPPSPARRYELIHWCLDNVEKVLSDQQPHSWMTRWFEVLKAATDQGYHLSVV